jgi:hypothetical protein
MKYRNSKDIKFKSEKQSRNEYIYDDVRDEYVNQDYAEPNYDQNYEEVNRYDYDFSLSPKREEMKENVGANQPYYISLYSKEDLKNMKPHPKNILFILNMFSYFLLCFIKRLLNA